MAASPPSPSKALDPEDVPQEEETATSSKAADSSSSSGSSSSSSAALVGFVIGKVQDGQVPSLDEVKRVMVTEPERVRVVILPDEQLRAMEYQKPSASASSAAAANPNQNQNQYQCLYGIEHTSKNPPQKSPRSCVRSTSPMEPTEEEETDDTDKK